MKEFINRFNNKNIAKTVLVLLVVLFVFELLYSMVAMININTDSGLGWQGDWIEMGWDIREGEYFYDGNINPLYSYLLTFVAGINIRGFTTAKLLSMGMVTALLLIMFLSSRKLVSGGGALVAVMLAAYNWGVFALAYTLRSEVVLLLFFYLAWYFIVAGFRDHRLWIPAGIFTGLSYLTKGTGQLLAVSFLITIVIVYRKELFKKAGVLYYFISYMMVALPLWAYNLKVYGSPFYNYSIKHAMWLDNWSDLQVIGGGKLPDMFSYLSSHSILEVIARELSGAINFIPVFFQTMLLSDKFLLGYLFKYVYLILVVTGLVYYLACSRDSVKLFLNKKKEMAIYTAVLLGIFLLLFSWYNQVSPSHRFVLPLVPILFVFLGEILYKSGKRLLGRLKVDSLALMFIVVAILLASVSVKVASYRVGNPFVSDRLSGETAEVMGWLAGLPENTRVVYGESGKLPLWLLRQRVFIDALPVAEELEGFLAGLKAMKTQYLIVDNLMVCRKGVFHSFLQPVSLTDFRINPAQVPGELELLFKNRGERGGFAVFKL